MHEYVSPVGCLRIDLVDGVVVVTGEGFWQDAGVEEHFVQLKQIVDRMRRAAGVARGLIDLRLSAVQRPSLVEDIRANAHDVWQAGDHVAIVTRTALLRRQMARVAEASRFRLFSTVEAARAWLDEAVAGRRLVSGSA